MHPNQIEVGKIYKNIVRDIYYIGVGSQKTDANGVLISNKLFDKCLVALNSLDRSGHKVVPYKKNPKFWEKIVKIDAKIVIKLNN